jgi:hypothetical protein
VKSEDSVAKGTASNSEEGQSPHRAVEPMVMMIMMIIIIILMVLFIIVLSILPVTLTIFFLSVGLCNQ